MRVHRPIGTANACGVMCVMCVASMCFSVICGHLALLVSAQLLAQSRGKSPQQGGALAHTHTVTLSTSPLVDCSRRATSRLLCVSECVFVLFFLTLVSKQLNY